MVFVEAPRSVVARGWALGSALFLAAILGACASDSHPVIVIENRLSEPVTVVFLNSQGTESSLVDTISPGLEYSVDVFSTDRCTPGVLIARDKLTGAEVARSQSPVCRPSRWIIDTPTGSSARWSSEGHWGVAPLASGGTAPRIGQDS